MKKILVIILIEILFLKLSFSQSGWQEQSIPYTNQGALVDVFFINENTGWFCGQFGKLGKTTNGGVNWLDISIDNGFNYECIFFINSNTGWIGLGKYIGSNYRGLIIKTTNGGSNWSMDTLQSEYNIVNKITFINSATGWASALGIYRTTNAGQNWSRYIINGYQNFSFSSVSFPNINTGYCNATFYNTYTNEQINIIAKSTNSGINWFVIRQDSLQNHIGEIQFPDVNTGYQCTNEPIKTTNGGISWTKTADNGNYYSMFFLNSNTGWFGRWDYSDITTNGGLSFLSQPLPISALFHGIYFVNESTGWGVGINIGVTYPRVFKTFSGGYIGIKNVSKNIPFEYSLSQNYPNPFNPVTKIKFDIPPSKTHGLVEGARGMIQLIIYDILGREIATLVNEYLSSGTYEVEWDGINYPSGVYFYKLITVDFSETKKMILIK